MVSTSLCLLAATVLAHSDLETTTPSDGALLKTIPAHIVFAFTKRTRLTQVRLVHDESPSIDLDLGNQTTFATRFKVPLMNRGGGRYHIEWRGLSGDGHPIRDTITFRIE